MKNEISNDDKYKIEIFRLVKKMDKGLKRDGVQMTLSSKINGKITKTVKIGKKLKEG